MKTISREDTLGCVTNRAKPYGCEEAMALTNAVQEANDIFSQAGVQIVMNEPVVVELEEMIQ